MEQPSKTGITLAMSIIKRPLALECLGRRLWIQSMKKGHCRAATAWLVKGTGGIIAIMRKKVHGQQPRARHRLGQRKPTN